MGMRHCPAVAVVIPVSKLRPFFETADWRQLEEAIDDRDYEEAANLIASVIPELGNCRVYVPAVEDVLPDGMEPDEPYAILDLEDAYLLHLRSDLEFLREEGVDFDVKAYAVWG